MRPLSRSLVVIAVAAGLALPAMVMAAPQGDLWLGHHDHSREAAPAPVVQSAAPAVGRQDMMARMKALDERIKTLTADMNMFVGDLKVQTMASLLTAMVERQSMMRDEMTYMRDGMMKMSMMNMAMPRDEESGKVCAPEAGGSR
jgi:hypothetical protein